MANIACMYPLDLARWKYISAGQPPTIRANYRFNFRWMGSTRTCSYLTLLDWAYGKSVQWQS